MCTTSRVGAHGMLLAQSSSAVSPGLPDLARTGVFAVGMHRNDTLQQVMQALELERPSPVWKPTVDFVPAVAKASLNLEQLVDLKVVSRWVLMPMNSTIGAFGLSGRSGQDKFTVACALTHRRAWEQMVDQHLSAAIIFEDDAYYALSLHNSTPRPIIPPTEALRRTLTAVSAVDPDWEYINLGRCYDFCTQTYQTSGPAGEQHIALNALADERQRLEEQRDGLYTELQELASPDAVRAYADESGLRSPHPNEVIRLGVAP